jgi:hypothetical protein
MQLLATQHRSTSATTKTPRHLNAQKAQAQSPVLCGGLCNRRAHKPQAETVFDPMDWFFMQAR